MIWRKMYAKRYTWIHGAVFILAEVLTFKLRSSVASLSTIFVNQHMEIQPQLEPKVSDTAPGGCSAFIEAKPVRERLTSIDYMNPSVLPNTNTSVSCCHMSASDSRIAFFILFQWLFDA